jgi:large subunit ribosomal protein L21
MYAVVMTGGKQVRLTEGDMVRVETINAPVGDTIELEDVRLVAKDDGLVADPETLKSSKVVCQVASQGRAKKIIVFKKKRRKGYKRKQGHRQNYTELKVREIVL